MSVPTNSYSTPTDGSTYFSAKLFAEDWESASADEQQKALNEATSIIEMFAYIGVPTSSTQDFQWPRTGIYLDGIQLDPTEIPAQILNAQYEIAFSLLQGYDPERDIRSSRVTSRGYSSVRTTYDPKYTPEFILEGVSSSRAWAYLSPFLDRDASGTIKFHRVS